MTRLILAWIVFLFSGAVFAQFDADVDLVSLHFDNTLDRADIHSSVADLMVVEDFELITLVIGGTYGTLNADQYDEQSVPRMDDVWAGNWINADADRLDAIDLTYEIWTDILSNGGEIWVAEGGPSDFTAAVTRLLQADGFDTRDAIHVVQHRLLNEENTDRVNLAYIQDNTDYIQIDDGNEGNETANFRQDGGSQAFVDAMADSLYDLEWSIAFDYLDPEEKLDFSDTVALLHIIGVSTSDVANISQFANRFTGSNIPATEEDPAAADSSTTEDESTVDTADELTTIDSTTDDEDIVDDEVLVDDEIFTEDDSLIDNEPFVEEDSLVDNEPFVEEDSLTDNEATVSEDSSADNDSADEGTVPRQIEFGVRLPQCLFTDSDSDGDGYGWELNSSCIVPGSGNVTLFTFPACESALADLDGDGWGWENNTSCLVVEVR